MSDTPVIRIVKKKAAHGAHHGGSWKVAYADFVTALMAFFLVMWIISMDQPVREKIQNYFNDPFSASQSKAGISSLAAGGRSPIASGFDGIGGAKHWRQLALEAQRDRFRRVEESLTQELETRPDLSRLGRHVHISVQRTGLVVELVEAEDAPFFEVGSARLPDATRRILTLIGQELARLPNALAVEGHTDSRAYGPDAFYTNWELSADRANAARRVLRAAGVRPAQVAEVRGYADRRLRNAAVPTHPSNRRVTILVNYSEDVLPTRDQEGAGDDASPESQQPFDPGIRPGPISLGR